MQKCFKFFIATFHFLVITCEAQQTYLQVIEADDTTKYELIYNSKDSLTNKELLAFYKENPSQLALKKSYFNGKQSGVTKSYFPSGKLYELIIYQNGLKEGDYSRFNSLGQLVVKARYKKGVKSGFYINRIKKYQGRYLDDKQHGKWEYNVGTPEYYRKYFKKGVVVEKRQIFPKLGVKKVPKPQVKKELTLPGNIDSIRVPINGDTSWFRLRYVPVDSLPHPAMRKAYFEKFPNVVAHTKYVYSGYINGMFKIYYTSGKLYRYSKYTAGLLDGPWKEYDEKGVLRIKGKYRDGLKVGKWQYNLGTPNYRKETYRSGIKVR